MEEERKGWQCPICETVYSPEVTSCDKCTKKEQKNQDTRQLLTE